MYVNPITDMTGLSCGYNLNNLNRGPLDDATYQLLKR